MAERYTKIYSLPENLYAENAPVVILAGALLKDNQTGKMLIQLKLQNIDKRTISSMRLRFLLLDNDGCQIGNPFYHEYDRLSFTENDYFGQRNPIVLPNDRTASYKISIEQVCFNVIGSSNWSSNSKWIPAADGIDTIKAKYQQLIAEEEHKKAELAKHEEAERKRIADEEHWRQERIRESERKTLRKALVIVGVFIAVLLSVFLTIKHFDTQEKSKIIAQALIGTSWTKELDAGTFTVIYTYEFIDDNNCTYTAGKSTATDLTPTSCTWKIKKISENTVTVLIDFTSSKDELLQFRFGYTDDQECRIICAIW